MPAAKFRVDPSLGGLTPLCLAARSYFGRPTVEALLDAGGVVLDDAGGEHTAVGYAAKLGNPAMLRLLLDNGCSPTATGTRGLPPLLAAVEDAPNVDAVAALLEHRCPFVDLTARHPANGRTALHFAARAGDGELCRLLLSRGANPGAKDNWYMIPNDMAASADARAAMRGAYAYRPEWLREVLGARCVPTAVVPQGVLDVVAEYQMFLVFPNAALQQRA